MRSLLNWYLWRCAKPKRVPRQFGEGQARRVFRDVWTNIKAFADALGEPKDLVVRTIKLRGEKLALYQFENRPRTEEFITTTLMGYALAVEAGLTLLLFLVSIIRRRRK